VTRCHVGLGSNLGDREAQLVAARAALAATPGIEVVAASRIYETEPVGPPQGRYLNAVLALETEFAPAALLARLLEIESTAGRTREPERNAPRTLDLDLLLYGDACIELPELRLPHPRLAERAFVLAPLAEIAGDFVLPGSGASVRDLAARASGGVAPWPTPPGWKVPC
jgi:2-amino-4-hydroxy-6-hydroxymethyldihydropteridine diphosphokinase